jgi:hypothetical protein
VIGQNDARYEIVLSTDPVELRVAADLSRKVGRTILADELERIADIVEEMHPTHNTKLMGASPLGDGLCPLPECYVTSGGRDFWSEEQMISLIVEIERLRQVARNVYEVWAGSDGIPQPETAAEAYLLKLIEQMRDEAKDGLHNAQLSRAEQAPNETAGVNGVGLNAGLYGKEERHVRM